jgi:hypothetical protein
MIFSATACIAGTATEFHNCFIADASETGNLNSSGNHCIAFHSFDEIFLISQST